MRPHPVPHSQSNLRVQTNFRMLSFPYIQIHTTIFMHSIQAFHAIQYHNWIEMICFLLNKDYSFLKTLIKIHQHKCTYLYNYFIRLDWRRWTIMSLLPNVWNHLEFTNNHLLIISNIVHFFNPNFYFSN